MPQGGIDPGEGPAEAALRELEEETGINSSKVVILAETQNWIPYELPPDLIPKLWNGKYRGQKQKWFLMRFLGEDTDIDIETEEPEFSSWKWIAPSALPDAIVPFKRDVYVAVLEAFQSHL
jgi:putative (di)nucleoside polyphosphate hydrolase